MKIISKRQKARKEFIAKNSNEKENSQLLEFILTYGWTIISAIILIGVLGVFGAFSSGIYTTEKIEVTPPFIGKSGVIISNGTNTAVQIGVINGGEDYTIIGLSLKDCGEISKLNHPVKSGETQLIGMICEANSIISKSKIGKMIKEECKITFIQTGSTLAQNSYCSFNSVIRSGNIPDLTLFSQRI